MLVLHVTISIGGTGVQGQLRDENRGHVAWPFRLKTDKERGTFHDL
jgi:hypothetical protein